MTRSASTIRLCARSFAAIPSYTLPALVGASASCVDGRAALFGLIMMRVMANAVARGGRDYLVPTGAPGC